MNRSHSVAQDRRRAAHNSQLELQIQALQQRNREMQTKIVNAAEVEFSLRKEIEIWQLAEHISTQDLDVAEMRQKIRELEEERTSNRTELTKQIQLIERYSKEAELLAQQNQTLVTERDSLNSKCNHLHNEQIAIQNQLDQLVDEYKNLHTENSSLQVRDKTTVSALAEVKFENDKIKDELSSVTHDLESERKNSSRLRTTLAEERNSTNTLQSRAESAEEELAQLTQERDSVMEELTSIVGVVHPLEEEVQALRERCAILEVETSGLSQLKQEHAEALAQADAAIIENSSLKEKLHDLTLKERRGDQKLQDALKKLAVERGRVSELESELKDIRKVHAEAETQLLNRIDKATNAADEYRSKVEDLTSNLSNTESEMARLRLLVAHRAKVTSAARSSTIEVARTLSSTSAARRVAPSPKFTRRPTSATATQESPDRRASTIGSTDSLMVSPRTPTPSASAP